MRVIIDRFEGGTAVLELENGNIINAPGELFPDAAEGDLVDIIVNKNETEIRKAKSSERLNNLFKRGQTNEKSSD